ncbi:LCP family protein [Rhodococcus antarcticus]|uniref:LCP family protein n=1 Tax=Rhodococcus antarcticus TaxID=2987751 RepID=A0ABY6NXH7_9NOCA|nr:LCP family protein [Rhodococcus antarcticus]UZJ23633.1 LCP family protein [Rhodococcus antarcticus]
MTKRRARRRRGLRRLALLLVATSAAVALLGAGAAWFFLDRYAGNVSRLPNVFVGLDQRPAETPGSSTTFLLVGADTRANGQTTGSAAVATATNTRSDTIMLVRLAADGTHTQVVSIPRDSWVEVPGYGKNKINAAYAFGGPRLLVQTVEQLTGVRIDHVAVVDFVGFTAVTDALGGVDVAIAAPTSQGGVSFNAGVNHLDGAQALAYVRERYDLPGGDFDRVARQQNYLRSVLSKAKSDGLLTDPGRLDNFMRTATASISVDDQLSNVDLVRLALDRRNASPSDSSFLTAPVAGTGMEGDQSVVYLDQAADAPLWDYLRQDTLQVHLGEFTLLPTIPS